MEDEKGEEVKEEEDGILASVMASGVLTALLDAEAVIDRDLPSPLKGIVSQDFGTLI
jgi:hypothetical protein